MYRGELLFFLLAVGIFSIDFLKDRVPHFFDFSTLPPKITQWELDSCSRTISVQSVAGGIPPYDFYVFQQDVLDSSNWQLFRWTKEQLPLISDLPPGNYRVKAVNEGVSFPSFSTNILEISFPADPEIYVHGSTSLCSGESPGVALKLAHLEGPLPFLWAAQVLETPEEGEVSGYTSGSRIPQIKISDSLVNTGKTVAKVSYQLQALINGCLRPAGTVTLQVNPKARIEASLSDNLICSGYPFSISLFPQSWGTSPMQVRWSVELLTGQITDFEENGLLTLSSLDPIHQNLINRGTAPARIRYSFFPSYNGCEGIAESLEVVVLPEPKVSHQEDLVICAGERVSIPEFASNFRGDSVRYSWLVSDSSIGLSNGNGHRIPDFRAIPSGSGSKQSLITVTPRLYSQGVSCIGPPHTFSLTVRAPLVIEEELSDYAGFGVSCSGAADGKIKIYPSGGILEGEEPTYTYSWSGPNGFSSSSDFLEGIQAGEYRVRIATGAGSCVVEKSLTLTQPEPLRIQVLSLSAGVLTCSGDASGEIQVEVGGGAGEKKLIWTAKDGGLVPTGMENAALLEGLQAGTYLLSVTDQNECSIEHTFYINEPEPLKLAQAKVDNLCFGQSSGRLSVVASGGESPYRYTWIGPNGFSTTNPNPQNLVSGAYQVTVTDANGCILVGPRLSISEPSKLSLSQSKMDNGCFEGTLGSISITASGGTAPYTYAWTGPNGFTSTSENLQNLRSGTYQVTVTDTNGCAIKGAIQTITEPAQLALTENKVDNTCFQGNTASISITVLGGTAPYTYVWTGPNGFTSTSEDLQNLLSGTYQVTVRDANNCTALVGPPITITEPAQLALTQSQVKNVCFQGNMGSISITPSGGTAPYTYAWTGPNGFTSTSEDLQNLLSGTYQVTIKDTNGCTGTGAAQTITEPTQLAINAQVQPETCVDAKDGRIELTPTGGTAPYQYSWDHGVTGTAATGLGAGTYRVTLRDQNGCTQTAEYVLLPVSVLRLGGTVTYQATQVPPQISALLQSDAQGGTPPYTYRWSTGQTTPSLTVSTSGTYTLQLKDVKSCVQEKEFVVNLPLPLAIEVDVNTLPLCEEKGQESTLRLRVQDGLPPYQITWTMGSVTATGLQFITRESGLVEVEVRDALGLVEKRTITILPRLTGPLDFEQLFESQSQFQAALVGFKGVFRPLAPWPHRVISWDFGDGSSSLQASPTHTYACKGKYTVTLTVLDNAGCQITHAKELDILDYFIEIPNVFTPNKDQLNDTFFPKFRFITHLQLQVMNPWGELIYRSRGLEDAGWDGNVAGQKAPEGVYVYKLSYQVPDGRSFTFSSTFLLAR